MTACNTPRGNPTEPGKGPKYAPAREDGLKPWFVEIFEWGRRRTKIVYADTAANARYKAIGRMRYTTAKVRRATPADIEAHLA